MSQDLVRERKVANYLSQASNPEMTEEQRELYRATKAVTWGFLLGQGARKSLPQLDPDRVATAIETALAEPEEGDIVVGRGPITGGWFVGRYVGPSKRWRDESEVEDLSGTRFNLVTKTLKVVEKRA
jgi:hypothetical protein